MSSGSNSAARKHVTPDGFEVLDQCHRDTLVALDTLNNLVARLRSEGDSDWVRAMAAEVVKFFSTTAREHHEDEERHVFPKALNGADPEIVQSVLRLQQDHSWLEEDWLELSSHLKALAAGQSLWDADFLREATEVFTALSHDHMALEESCIYPQARAGLQAGERHEMGREMAARRRAHRQARGGAR
ncbi:MAG TPA: hemerythrin domain-containing protein [Burkholderiaceae bacterium]|nr:hemerythrin domain-containing protein [Burkholderiaceae bacterium]